MKLNSKILQYVLIICFLTEIGSSTSLFTLTPQLCSTNPGLKSNTIEITNLEFSTSSLQKSAHMFSYYGGNVNIFLINAKKQNENTFVMEMLFSDFSSAAQQDATLLNGFDILEMRNQIAILKVYTNNEKTSFSLKYYYFDQALASPSAKTNFNPLYIKSITGLKNEVNVALTSFTFERILNYAIDRSKFYILINDNNNIRRIYEINLSDGSISYFKKAPSSATNIVGGFSRALYDTVTQKIYASDSDPLVQYTIDGFFTTSGRSLQKNVFVANLHGYLTFFYSYNDDMTSGAILHSINGGNGPNQMKFITFIASSTQNMKFYNDGLNNFIVSTDVYFNWWNFRWDTLSVITNINYFINLATDSNDNRKMQILKDFNYQVTVSTYNSKAFILTSSRLIIYTIFRSQGVNYVSKLQQVNIDTSKVTEIVDTQNTVYKIQIKCKCAVSRPPKLFCFQPTLTCIAINQKIVNDCTLPTENI